jgi:hypothetical protein
MRGLSPDRVIGDEARQSERKRAALLGRPASYSECFD